MFSLLSAIDLPNPMTECVGRSTVVTGFCLLISGMKTTEKDIEILRFKLSDWIIVISNNIFVP